MHIDSSNQENKPNKIYIKGEEVQQPPLPEISPRRERQKRGLISRVQALDSFKQTPKLT